MNINALQKNKPVLVSIASYFSGTFIGTGAIAWTFDHPMFETLFFATFTSIIGGVVGAVKGLDKMDELD